MRCAVGGPAGCACDAAQLRSCLGPAPTLQPSAPLVHTELKADAKGQKEFQDYRTKLEIQKSDLQDRIRKNKEWIVSGAGVHSLSGATGLQPQPHQRALAHCDCVVHKGDCVKQLQ